MPSYKSLSTPILATFFSLNPGISIAAEDSLGSIFPVWPFFAILLVIVIFRKQLNCNPPVTLDEVPTSSPAKQEKTTIVTDNPEPALDTTTAEIDVPDVTPEADVTPETEVTPKAEDNIIDLKDNSQQCQASTAKGTRCKRKTTLEEASVSIDNKTYLLTVCRQHNNGAIVPFSELIK